jgi:ATP-dependent exoDNAse (exonuclease V) alpha subunit
VAHLKLDETNHLPHKVELVIGMKAMVTMNISTETDLANGSRGVVEDIILDPRERVDPGHGKTIRLQYPPAAVLFKPLFSRKHTFPGLPEGTIPIFPTRKSFQLGGKTGIHIDRDQIALTPAYAFTDFKSQGQTIENVIVDLAKPPSGNLTGFNAYISLSRSRRRNNIRLLQDFDERLFTVHPNEHLRREDARLD